MSAVRRTLIWAVVTVFIAEVAWFGVHGDWTMTGLLGFAIIGAVILTERPGNVVGRFLIGIAIAEGVIVWSQIPEFAAQLPAWLESILWAASFAFWAVFWLFGVIFPSGRPETRLGRAVLLVVLSYGAVSAILALLSSSPLLSGRQNPFAVPAIAGLTSITSWLSFAVLLPVAAGMVIDLTLRWRRADSVERLQYRWFFFGIVSMIVVILAVVGVNAVIGETTDALTLQLRNLVGSLALNLPPIAIGIAITRHGLYSIGRVISRAVTYAIVTLLVVGVYVGLVVGLTALLPGLPSVGVALATLAAAALFLPALRWVQRRIDRAFDRERYNAIQVVEAFGERLRTGADPSATGTDLIAAAERTLQPTTIGLWDRRENAVKHDAGLRWLAHLVGALLLAALITAIVTRFWVAAAGWGFIGFLIVMAGTGWFLAARLPRHPIGWLLLAVPGLFATELSAELLGRSLLTTSPGAAAWLFWYGHDRADLETWSFILPLGLMLTQVPLRFPTGRLPSPRWRWFSWTSAVAIVAAAAVQSTYARYAADGIPNPAHIPGIESLQFGTTSVLIIGAIIGSFASLFVRYRSASAQERAQLRWLLWSIPIALSAAMIDLLVPADIAVVHDWVQLLIAAVPLAMMVGVLRYHLWAIDRIISRTAAYAIVTIAVVGVYVVVVLGATRLLPGLPSVGVALATLAAAAVFLPLLRMVRGWIDRRFDRAQYNAQRVVDDFGERLRNGADPYTAAADLVAAVETTLQPTLVSIWTPGGTPWNRP